MDNLMHRTLWRRSISERPKVGGNHQPKRSLFCVTHGWMDGRMSTIHARGVVMAMNGSLHICVWTWLRHVVHAVALCQVNGGRLATRSPPMKSQ